jgi:hypothetical protein
MATGNRRSLYNLLNKNLAHGEVYLIQVYVIKFVSDNSYLHLKNWPPRYNWSFVESGVKYHTPPPFLNKQARDLYDCMWYKYYISLWVNEWLLLNTTWTIFQPYHGENELHSMSWTWCPLCTRPTRLVEFLILLAHWNSIQCVDLMLHA